MSKKENIKKTKFPVVLWFSIVASLIVIIISFFRWSLMDLISPFLEIFLELIVFGFFFIILVWSLVFGFLKFKSQKIKAFYPLLINFVILLIIFFVPFTAITLKMDFYFHLNKREEVIKKITNGELIPNSSHNDKWINLPVGYKNISKDGGVEVEYDNENPNSNPNVFFFTFLGIIDSFAGFIYKSDNNEPQQSDFECGYILGVKKIKDHWYFVSCT